jgi:hypothetical protein
LGAGSGGGDGASAPGGHPIINAHGTAAQPLRMVRGPDLCQLGIPPLGRHGVVACNQCGHHLGVARIAVDGKVVLKLEMAHAILELGAWLEAEVR